MRLIDADDLLEIIEKYCGDYDCHDSESFDKQAVRMAIRSAPTITPQNEWVSVEEKLPPPKQNVLAYSTRSGIAEADYADGVWMQYRWSAVMESVTHWMPLPEPPEKESEGR